MARASRIPVVCALLTAGSEDKGGSMMLPPEERRGVAPEGVTENP
jgi:hypothetical protein